MGWSCGRFECINTGLTKPDYTSIRITAAQWTAKGNLVLTASLTTTHQHLNTAALEIRHLAMTIQKRPKIISHINFILPTVRPNVKWARILLNGSNRRYH